jgi:hypothetical protein
LYAPQPTKKGVVLAVKFLPAIFTNARSTAISLAWFGRPAMGPSSTASAGTS